MLVQSKVYKTTANHFVLQRQLIFEYTFYPKLENMETIPGPIMIIKTDGRKKIIIGPRIFTGTF